MRALIQHRESRHAVKYGIVGVSNVAIDFALFALLVSVGVWYPIAKTLSLIAATINGYTFNRKWTFRAGAYRHETLVRYAVVQTTSLGLNIAALAVLVERGGLDPRVAQALVLPFLATMAFLANRFWTFGRHLPEPR
jgi:putative flippase GtrA